MYIVWMKTCSIGFRLSRLMVKIGSKMLTGFVEKWPLPMMAIARIGTAVSSRRGHSEFSSRSIVKILR
jgi:hypothetical protein